MSTTEHYDAEFEQLLINHGIYPDGYEGSDGETREPENIDLIRRRLAKRRRSLSPSRFDENAFEDFKRRNHYANSDSKTMSGAIPVIAGAEDRRCRTQEDIPFTNLERFAPGFPRPQPDRYYGAHTSLIDRRVRDDLLKHIVPNGAWHLPAAPNFFVEGMSLSGRADVAERQVRIDNAYGARGLFYLQNYGKQTPVYDGKAYTIGLRYHPDPGVLHMYATHPRESATGDTEYHTTQLGVYILTNDLESFRQGASAYRNARDFADEQRTDLIARANAVVRSPSTESHSGQTSSTTGTSFAMASSPSGSNTSVDELSLDYDPPSDDSAGKSRPGKG